MARAALAAGWAAAITGAAVALHFARLPRALGKVASYEPVHVAAHLLLYGVLAALVASWLRGWGWKVLAAVAVAGFGQEACQTLGFGLPMGAHEAKDFAVDLLGAAIAMGMARLARAARPVSMVAGGRPKAPGEANDM